MVKCRHNKVSKWLPQSIREQIWQTLQPLFASMWLRKGKWLHEHGRCTYASQQCHTNNQGQLNKMEEKWHNTWMQMHMTTWVQRPNIYNVGKIIGDFLTQRWSASKAQIPQSHWTNIAKKTHPQNLESAAPFWFASKHLWDDLLHSLPCSLLHFSFLIHPMHMGYLNCHFPLPLWIYSNLIHSYTLTNHHPMTTSNLMFYLQQSMRANFKT